MEYWETYNRKVKPPKLPIDRSGLWKVVAATGEESAAVAYDVAGAILGAWRKKTQFHGVKIKIIQA